MDRDTNEYTITLSADESAERAIKALERIEGHGMQVVKQDVRVVTVSEVTTKLAPSGGMPERITTTLYDATGKVLAHMDPIGDAYTKQRDDEAFHQMQRFREDARRANDAAIATDRNAKDVLAAKDRALDKANTLHTVAIAMRNSILPRGKNTPRNCPVCKARLLKGGDLYGVGSHTTDCPIPRVQW